MNPIITAMFDPDSSGGVSVCRPEDSIVEEICVDNQRTHSLTMHSIRDCIQSLIHYCCRKLK